MSKLKSTVPKLKLCPFCNGKAAVIGTDQFVMCVKCKAKAPSIEAWNTRAERTCHNESSGFLCNRCKFGDFGSFQFSPSYCPSCGARVVG